MAGFAPLSRPTPRLAQLSDAELAQLNAMLPWQCFTVAPSGRRFGDRAWAGKREVDPVAHLRQLAALARVGMMLDTHVARPGEAQAEYESGRRRYAYRRLKESGVSDAFSGMYDHAKWLTLDALVGLLRELGFASVSVHEEREERNGLRILLFARRERAA
jgi:hypothetical protein